MTGSYESHQDIDEVFESLIEPRRRYVIRCLQNYGKSMALADLADEIAAWENDAPLTEVSPEEVKRIYLSLYHKHLPKLDSAGVVRYDQERDMVQLAEETLPLEQAEKLLDTTSS
jgi:hypothetical protein